MASRGFDAALELTVVFSSRTRGHDVEHYVAFHSGADAPAAYDPDRRVGTRRLKTSITTIQPGGSMSVQKIAFLVALLLAVVAAFATIPYAALILAVLGLIGGLTVVAEEHVRVIVSALALKYFADIFGAIPQVGGYVTSIIGNVALIAAGAALMIIFRNIYGRVKP